MFIKRISTLWMIAAIACVLTPFAHADEVEDWNGHLLEALRTANTGPLPATRIGAIVHAAVFDALNGIERRYPPIHVAPDAARGANRRAAVVQAAYVTLVRLFPTQQLVLDAKRQVALDNIARDRGEQNSSIANGIAWGQKVADAILAWRSTDGFTPPPPPFLGGMRIGQWRPTPTDNLPGAGVQFATMTPWVLRSPSHFRPGPPPSLTSRRYTIDFNEVKTMGSLNSTTRTADQTLAALFWNGSTVVYLWDSVAVSLGKKAKTNMSDNARLLAVLNVGMADAAIACWDAKYTYEYWRPITAIRLAADDGNPATEADTAWQPLFATPAHPDYPSGHSCVSGAAGRLLGAYFGEHSSFTVKSDVMIGTRRSFHGFERALEEVKEARIFSGIHFRSATEVGQKLGIDVANYVLERLSSR
jgi:hypothetical protein